MVQERHGPRTTLKFPRVPYSDLGSLGSQGPSVLPRTPWKGPLGPPWSWAISSFGPRNAKCCMMISWRPLGNSGAHDSGPSDGSESWVRPFVCRFVKTRQKSESMSAFRPWRHAGGRGTVSGGGVWPCPHCMRTTVYRCLTSLSHLLVLKVTILTLCEKGCLLVVQCRCVV